MQAATPKLGAQTWGSLLQAAGVRTSKLFCNGAGIRWLAVLQGCVEEAQHTAKLQDGGPSVELVLQDVCMRKLLAHLSRTRKHVQNMHLCDAACEFATTPAAKRRRPGLQAGAGVHGDPRHMRSFLGCLSVTPDMSSPALMAPAGA